MLESYQGLMHLTIKREFRAEAIGVGAAGLAASN